MNRVALATFSFFDTAGQPEKEDPERFYHGFALGLMVVELAALYTRPPIDRGKAVSGRSCSKGD